MGAYGSPDLYPYDKMERRCPKCGRMVTGKYCPECGAKMTDKQKKRTSIDEGDTGNPTVAIIVLVAVVMFIFLVGTDKSLNSLFACIVFPSLFATAVYVIKIIISAIRGKRNHYNIKWALVWAVVTIVAFISFGLTM